MDKLVQFSFSAIRQGLVISIFLMCFHLNALQAFTQNKSYPFKPGEKMIYSMHFGWFEIGEAEVWIDPEIYYPDGNPHYLIRCNITSSPWFRIFAKLDMCFESLVHVENLRPYSSFRDLRQGKKIDVRHDQFTFGDSIEVVAYIEDIDAHRYHKFENSQIPFRDALSTYLWLRSKNLPDLQQGLGIRTFFTNDLYEFEIQPARKGKFSFEGNRIATSEFKLHFPISNLFPKGKSGYVIVSSDERRLPLKFKINMSLGSFFFDLEELSK